MTPIEITIAISVVGISGGFVKHIYKTIKEGDKDCNDRIDKTNERISKTREDYITKNDVQVQLNQIQVSIQEIAKAQAEANKMFLEFIMVQGQKGKK